MPVGELQSELSQMNPEEEVWIAVNGTFVPVVGTTAVPNGTYIVIRGKGKIQQSNRFTTAKKESSAI